MPIARLAWSGHLSRRRQVYVKSSRLIEQPNRTVERRRTRVHVLLPHAQFPMSGQLLNRSRRCAAHRPGPNRTCDAGCGRLPAIASLDATLAARDARSAGSGWPQKLCEQMAKLPYNMCRTEEQAQHLVAAPQPASRE